MTRFNDVTKKLKQAYNKKNEQGRDDYVSQLKIWLKHNRNTQDKEKKQAIECFLEEI